MKDLLIDYGFIIVAALVVCAVCLSPWIYYFFEFIN